MQADCKKDLLEREKISQNIINDEEKENLRLLLSGKKASQPFNLAFWGERASNDLWLSIMCKLTQCE